PVGGAAVAVQARGGSWRGRGGGAARRDGRAVRRRDRDVRGSALFAAAGQTAAAAARAPPRGRTVPALRHEVGGGPLRGLRDRLLPGVSDGWEGAEGPAAVAAVEVTRVR